MSFTDEINEISSKAHSVIVAAVKAKGTINVIDEDDDRDMCEIVCELPVVSTVGKYGDYDEFAIISLSIKDDKVTLHTDGKGDAEEKRDFPLEELDVFNMCALADEIK